MTNNTNSNGLITTGDILKRDIALTNMLINGLMAYDMPLVREIIDSGININIYTDKGTTPLITAAEYMFREAVCLMISRGADVNMSDSDGDTSLIKAVTCGHAGLDHEGSDIIRKLIAAGADINAANADGMTALMAAAWQLYEDPNIVRILLDAGAAVNLTDRRGNTALSEAAEAKNTEIVKILISAGADVNMRGRRGMTSLHLAAAVGSAEIVGLLVKAGADIGIKDDDGRTAADIAKNDSIRRYLTNAAILKREDGENIGDGGEQIPDFNI